MTTAARLDRTNIQPVLRYPVVAGLHCIPIRIPLLSTSPPELHPRPACCPATRSDRPTPALAPRMPDRRGFAKSQSIIGLQLHGVVGRTFPQSAVMNARQAETNQHSAVPGPRQHIGMVHWQAEHHLFRSCSFPRNRMDPCHPVAAMGSGRIHPNRPTCLGSGKYGLRAVSVSARRNHHPPGQMAWHTAFGLAPGPRTPVAHSY